MNIKWLLIPLALVLAVIGAIALLPGLRGGRENPTVAIDAAARNQAIDALVQNLNQHYVFPDTARQIESLLRERQRQGAYDGLGDGGQLAQRLSADIASVAHDLHMKVGVSADVLPPQPKTDFRTQPLRRTADDPADNVFMRAINRVGRKLASFGVEEAEFKPSNIGYLKLSHFPMPYLAAEKYGAAMDKLAGADALIIDLRENSGGAPHTVALLISYFVDQRTRLNDLWSRDTGWSQQFWTEDQLAGTRFGSARPVAILVGPHTRSAAEDFAYTMQALKRATVIGQATWGGAHPTGRYRLGDHLFAAIPDYRSINPITKTNWEGVGVIPDVAVTPEKAMAAATAMLQRQLKGGTSQIAAQ